MRTAGNIFCIGTSFWIGGYGTDTIYDMVVCDIQNHVREGLETCNRSWKASGQIVTRNLVSWDKEFYLKSKQGHMDVFTTDLGCWCHSCSCKPTLHILLFHDLLPVGGAFEAREREPKSFQGWFESHLAVQPAN